MSPTSICFFVSELMVLWLLRIFALSGGILSPTFSVAFLNSHIIFRICSLEVANSITSSANLKFVRQSRSWSLRYIPIPFFFCHRCISSFKRVLKHCVEQQAGHRIFLLRSFLDVENVALFVCLYRSLLVSVYLPQEADVLVIDVARFECLPNRFVRDGVECLREVDRRCPHFDSPLMAFLFNQSVCCKVVSCLVGFSESSLIFCLFSDWRHFTIALLADGSKLTTTVLPIRKTSTEDFSFFTGDSPKTYDAPAAAVPCVATSSNVSRLSMLQETRPTS